jgi:hypothetical protein
LEVGAALAAGADDEIGIGNVRRIEVRGDRFRRDRLRRKATGGHLGRERRGARNLLPRAVIEGELRSQAGIASVNPLGLLQEAADLGIEEVSLADDAYPHVLGAARQDRCGRSGAAAPSGRGPPPSAATSSPN